MGPLVATVCLGLQTVAAAESHDAGGCLRWGGAGGLDTATVVEFLRTSAEAHLCFELGADTDLVAPLRIPVGKSVLVRAGEGARVSAAGLTERAFTLAEGSALTLQGLVLTDAPHGVVASFGGEVRVDRCTFANNTVASQRHQQVDALSWLPTVDRAAGSIVGTATIVAYAGSLMGGKSLAGQRGLGLRASAAAGAAGAAFWPVSVEASHSACATANPNCHSNEVMLDNQSSSFCTSGCAPKGSTASVCGQVACSGGAAIMVEGATLVVEHSRFESNKATNGGAIYWSGKGQSTFECVISETNFTRNVAQDSLDNANSGTGGGRGGAVFIANAPDGPSVTTTGIASFLTNNKFTGNVALSRVSSNNQFTHPPRGGAVYVQNVGVVASDCTFTKNGAAIKPGSTQASGGAVALLRSSAPQLTSRFDRCTFTRNDAKEGAAIFSGSETALVMASKLAFVDCAFTENGRGLDNVVAEYGFSNPTEAATIVTSADITIVSTSGLQNSDLSLRSGGNLLSCSTNPATTACAPALTGPQFEMHSSPNNVLGTCFDCSDGSGVDVCANGQVVGVDCTRKNIQSGQPLGSTLWEAKCTAPPGSSDTCTTCNAASPACDSRSLCQSPCTPNPLIYDCAVGHFGLKCEACDSTLQCSNNGACTGAYPLNATFGVDLRCACFSGYSGDTCQADADECASAPCKHGGTCYESSTLASVAPGAFFCACTNGWSGVSCETDIDECASSPCRHGGICIDSTTLTGTPHTKEDGRYASLHAGYGAACAVRPDPPPSMPVAASPSSSNASAGGARRRRRTQYTIDTGVFKIVMSEGPPVSEEDSVYSWWNATVGTNVNTANASSIVPLVLEQMGFDIGHDRPSCSANVTTKCNDLTVADYVAKAIANMTSGTGTTITITRARFLAWFPLQPEWARDQLTHGCVSESHTDPLYRTSPSSGNALPVREYYDPEKNECKECYSLAPVGDFLCECWRTDGYGWRPEEGKFKYSPPGGVVQKTSLPTASAPYSSKLRDPALAERIGKDTCSYVQDQCQFFCATTDSGCLKPSLQVKAETKDLASSWLESPCFNKAQCSTVATSSASISTFYCGCVDGYEGSKCSNCEGTLKIMCDEKYIVVAVVGGLLFLTMAYIAPTTQIIGDKFRAVKSCWKKVMGLCTHRIR